MHGLGAKVYEITLLEVAWGCGLIALTMLVHAVGMNVTASVSRAVTRWAQRQATWAPLIAPLVIAAWLICVVHLLEVVIWAGFLLWKGLLPGGGVAYSYALMTYTTLGSQFELPLEWRVLQGMLAMAGLLTFAWSTAVLVTLAQYFQSRHLRPRQAGGPDHR